MEDSKGQNIFRYNVDIKKLELTDIPFENIKLKEKNFFKFKGKNDIYFTLTDFYRKCPQVAFYVKNKHQIRVVNYEPNYKVVLVDAPDKLSNKHNYNFLTKY